jgi:hypothetical protein
MKRFMIALLILGLVFFGCLGSGSTGAGSTTHPPAVVCSLNPALTDTSTTYQYIREGTGMPLRLEKMQTVSGTCDFLETPDSGQYCAGVYLVGDAFGRFPRTENFSQTTVDTAPVLITYKEVCTGANTPRVNFTITKDQSSLYDYYYTDFYVVMGQVRQK